MSEQRFQEKWGTATHAKKAKIWVVVKETQMGGGRKKGNWMHFGSSTELITCEAIQMTASILIPEISPPGHSPHVPLFRTFLLLSIYISILQTPVFQIFIHMAHCIFFQANPTLSAPFRSHNVTASAADSPSVSETPFRGWQGVSMTVLISTTNKQTRRVKSRNMSNQSHPIVNITGPA